MNINSRLFRVISSVLTILVIVEGALCIFSNYPRVDYTEGLNSFYNEEENSLDYVVIGSSATLRGIAPHIIENKYGLKGCNISIIGASPELYLEVLEEVIKYQKNPLIIVDMDEFVAKPDDAGIEAEKYWLNLKKRDNQWLSSVLLKDNNAVEYLFPIIKYHKNITRFYTSIKTSYKGLKMKMFNDTNPLKGTKLEKGIHVNKFDKVYSGQYKERTIEDYNRQELISFLESCKNNNISNVVFVNCPKLFSDDFSDFIEEMEITSNYYSPIIESYGYDYFSYSKTDNILGLTHEDFFDTFHLNESGANKFSQYLGKYILLKNFKS